MNLTIKLTPKIAVVVTEGNAMKNINGFTTYAKNSTILNNFQNS